MPVHHSALLRALLAIFMLPFFCLAHDFRTSSGWPATRSQGYKSQGYKSQGYKSQTRQSQVSGTDAKLRAVLQANGVEAIDTPEQDPKHAALGNLLFFDRIICGNNDTACATCHHPLTSTSDTLSLGVGTGSPNINEVGIFRVMGEGREFVPRNAPDIFNRGSVHWTSMFWDSRVSTAGGVATSPAGAALPSELVKPLQIQAMFPPTSRDEMRGSHEDVFNGNDFAAFADDDFTGIWGALSARVMDNDIYRSMFLDAFPEVPEADLGFQHVAIALAAFETEAFGMDDSPFDEFLRGNTQAMSPAAKRGALLFYGKAGCVDCHSGTLLTDQLHHNLAVPQIGPGKNPLTGLDHGRMGITADPADEFAFRTPPLRNVAATGPWMHNGAFSSLEDVIEHHLDPKKSLRDYRARLQLVQPDLIPTVVNGRTMQDWMLDTAEEVDVDLSRKEKSDLIEFLHSLTAPDLAARLQALIPAAVPSGMLENGLGE